MANKEKQKQPQSKVPPQPQSCQAGLQISGDPAFVLGSLVRESQILELT